MVSEEIFVFLYNKYLDRKVDKLIGKLEDDFLIDGRLNRIQIAQKEFLSKKAIK